MGLTAKYKCLDCNKEFSASSGGGFLFDLLTCSLCARTKNISHNELGELRDDYLKSALPFDFGSPERDSLTQKYEEAINQKFGGCRCGGSCYF